MKSGRRSNLRYKKIVVSYRYYEAIKNMADKLPPINLRPIGIVRNQVKEPTREGWAKVVSDIVLDGSLTEALDGLEKFSHVIVLYWMHRAAGQVSAKVHPQGNQRLPLVGVFATRSPKRPNPIGKATVRLIQRQGNILKVRGLDAIDGTSVLDIKPYIPNYDSAKNARVAPLGNRTMSTLRQIYRKLMNRYGPQHWWPADEPFEVIVGAILTQSAAWINVEKAIANLKEAGALSPRALRRLGQPELARLIRPSGYYNAKALKLKAFAQWLSENYNDDLDKLFAGDIPQLRQQLLSLHGIGEETADSIILYAANKPVFVVDAYTRRIISRIGIVPESNSYSAFQSLFMDNLPADVTLFNEYHALLVHLGKNVCRKQPLCPQCPLNAICRFYFN